MSVLVLQSLCMWCVCVCESVGEGLSFFFLNVTDLDTTRSLTTDQPDLKRLHLNPMNGGISTINLFISLFVQRDLAAFKPFFVPAVCSPESF